MPAPQMATIAVLRVRTRPVQNGQKPHLFDVKITDAKKHFKEDFRVQAGATVYVSYPKPVQVTLPLSIKDGMGGVLGIDIGADKESGSMQTVHGEPPKQGE